MHSLDDVNVISAEDKAFLASIRETIQAVCPDASVVLYGSVACGQHDAESDYDILVLTKADIDKDAKDRLRNSVFHLEMATGKVISEILMTTEQWRDYVGMPFYREVDCDGVAL